MKKIISNIIFLKRSSSKMFNFSSGRLSLNFFTTYNEQESLIFGSIRSYSFLTTYYIFFKYFSKPFNYSLLILCIFISCSTFPVCYFLESKSYRLCSQQSLLVSAASSADFVVYSHTSINFYAFI